MSCNECVPRTKPNDPLPHWFTAEKHQGWYSRRNPTREAQDAEKAKRKNRKAVT
jgi:hypothetical protein